MNSLLPFICRSVGGRTIRLLLDTGAAKNYINPSVKLKHNIFIVNSPFNVRSIHGKNRITHKTLLSIFGDVFPFFILPELSTFDGIVGFDMLLAVNAIIDLKNGILITDAGIEKLNYYKCSDVNSL